MPKDLGGCPVAHLTENSFENLTTFGSVHSCNLGLKSSVLAFPRWIWLSLCIPALLLSIPWHKHDTCNAENSISRRLIAWQLAQVANLTFTKHGRQFHYIKSTPYVVKCVLGKKSQKISAPTVRLRPIRPQNLVVSLIRRWHEVAEREYSQNWGFYDQFTTALPTHCAPISKPTSYSDVSPSRLWRKCERNPDTTNGYGINPGFGNQRTSVGSHLKPDFRHTHGMEWSIVAKP